MSRLVCLNKEAENHGRLDAIRPIAIDSMLVKIMERCIQDLLDEINSRSPLINPKQIGFAKGLGCDVNLMRLRQKVYEVKKSSSNESSFILFIDFAAAFDSVNHRLLFSKMKKKNIPNRIISAIKKIYSSSTLRSRQQESTVSQSSRRSSSWVH